MIIPVLVSTNGNDIGLVHSQTQHNAPNLFLFPKGKFSMIDVNNHTKICRMAAKNQGVIFRDAN